MEILLFRSASSKNLALGMEALSLDDQESAIEEDVSVEDIKKELTNCIYLQDSSVTLCGLKIYGSPWQPEFCGWAFNLPRGQVSFVSCPN